MYVFGLIVIWPNLLLYMLRVFWRNLLYLRFQGDNLILSIFPVENSTIYDHGHQVRVN